MLRIVNRLPLERRILLLYWSPAGARVRVSLEQHMRALRRLPGRNHVVAYNASRGAPGWLRTFRPDAIVLHTTFLALRWIDGFESRRARSAWIGEARCTKLALPQDDYDHAETLDVWLEELGVDAVLTALPEHASTLYPRTSRRAEIVKVLTGYVDEEVVAARPRPQPLAERPLDVVYRATALPLLVRQPRPAEARGRRGGGARGDADRPARRRLDGPGRRDRRRRVARLPGVRAWPSSAARRGSSALDRAGELRGRVAELLRDDPDTSFAEVARLLPPGWDDHRFFALGPAPPGGGLDGNRADPRRGRVRRRAGAEPALHPSPPRPLRPRGGAREDGRRRGAATPRGHGLRGALPQRQLLLPAFRRDDRARRCTSTAPSAAGVGRRCCGSHGSSPSPRASWSGVRRSSRGHSSPPALGCAPDRRANASILRAVCGIGGAVSLARGPVPRLRPALGAMNELIAHRGPDGEGTWVHDDERVGFAHRRLTIIDLETGDQPMTDGRQLDHLQRRDLQLPRAARRARRATGSARARTPRRSSTATARGARTA